MNITGDLKLEGLDWRSSVRRTRDRARFRVLRLRNLEVTHKGQAGR